MKILFAVAAIAAPTAALAAPGDPARISDHLSIDPIVEARLRHEHVDQPATDADALTLRLRAGAEFRIDRLALLVEGEGTLGIVNNYNAFPFAVADRQRRPGHSVVPDPMNIDLNRLQLRYSGKAATVTIGRQRINHDDQRWVGSVAWRQNEQTFDAMRAEAKIGPVAVDATYALSQRTIFGIDAGPRQAYDGDFTLLRAAGSLGPVTLSGFAYLLDYNEALVLANSSQSYGAKAVAALPLSPSVTLNLTASYARQSDYGGNPVNYAADYIAADANLAIGAVNLIAGWESLGADGLAAGGAGRAVQMPLATLHKFNGWADMFLTTPNTGLRDLQLGAAVKFAKVKAVQGLNATIIWHRFDSAIRDVRYGSEWNASVGFRTGRLAWLVKYARYEAQNFAVDTEKLWLQAEFAL